MSGQQGAVSGAAGTQLARAGQTLLCFAGRRGFPLHKLFASLGAGAEAGLGKQGGKQCSLWGVEFGAHRLIAVQKFSHPAVCAKSREHSSE